MSEFLLDLDGLGTVLLLPLLTGVRLLTELGRSRVVADFPLWVVLSDGLPKGRFAPRPVLLMAAFDRALGPFASFLGSDVLPSTGFFVVFLVCAGGLTGGVGVVLGAEFSSGTGVMLSGFGSVGEITILGSFSTFVISVTLG